MDYSGELFTTWQLWSSALRSECPCLKTGQVSGVIALPLLCAAGHTVQSGVYRGRVWVPEQGGNWAPSWRLTTTAGLLGSTISCNSWRLWRSKLRQHLDGNWQVVRYTNSCQYLLFFSGPAQNQMQVPSEYGLPPQNYIVPSGHYSQGPGKMTSLPLDSQSGDYYSGLCLWYQPKNVADS